MRKSSTAALCFGFVVGFASLGSRAGDADLGLRRRRRREPVQPHGALQDVRGRDQQDRRRRLHQRAGLGRLRRRDDYQSRSRLTAKAPTPASWPRATTGHHHQRRRHRRSRCGTWRSRVHAGRADRPGAHRHQRDQRGGGPHRELLDRPLQQPCDQLQPVPPAASSSSTTSRPSATAAAPSAWSTGRASVNRLNAYTNDAGVFVRGNAIATVRDSTAVGGSVGFGANTVRRRRPQSREHHRRRTTPTGSWSPPARPCASAIR